LEKIYAISLTPYVIIRVCLAGETAYMTFWRIYFAAQDGDGGMKTPATLAIVLALMLGACAQGTRGSQAVSDSQLSQDSRIGRDAIRVERESMKVDRR
jgi:hypothetical protein